jgi:hypothetical protein
MAEPDRTAGAERSPAAVRPMSMKPPQPELMTGDEPIGGGEARLRDFWSWCLSDLRTNTVRPMLAEFLVARALDAADRPRVEWDAYDVLTPDGVRVEVKSAAYLQAWAQAALSKVRFGGLNARTWTAETGYSAAGSYNADVYVFAIQTATDHASYDALDLGQWLFWVLPRSAVEGTGLRSMQLARVQALAGAPTPYGELATAVREAAIRDRTSEDG